MTFVNAYQASAELFFKKSVRSKDLSIAFRGNVDRIISRKGTSINVARPR